VHKTLTDPVAVSEKHARRNFETQPRFSVSPIIVVHGVDHEIGPGPSRLDLRKDPFTISPEGVVLISEFARAGHRAEKERMRLRRRCGLLSWSSCLLLLSKLSPFPP
jgi:hypothetical protein